MQAALPVHRLQKHSSVLRVLDGTLMHGTGMHRAAFAGEIAWGGGVGVTFVVVLRHHAFATVATASRKREALMLSARSRLKPLL